MKDQGVPIRVVARRTGLSPHVIRVWERRYKALQPTRTETNRRLYSAEDVEKLNLLQAAISSGHSIGRIAALPVDELRQIVTAETARTHSDRAGSRYLETCMDAVRLLDERKFESELRRAGVVLGHIGVMQRVIAPLLEQIGELWRDGDLRVAHEHMASAVIRSILSSIRDVPELSETAPRIVVTTPSGHLHEFGAMLAANTAASEGWHVVYLGPNLPASEIAGAAFEVKARVVALSLIHPPDDTRVTAELRELRKGIGSDIGIVVGGRSSASYSDVLRDMDAVRVEDLSSFRSALEKWR
jgi:methanogenic corrinoid protein MtbC1